MAAEPLTIADVALVTLQTQLEHAALALDVSIAVAPLCRPELAERLSSLALGIAGMYDAIGADADAALDRIPVSPDPTPGRALKPFDPEGLEESDE